MSVTVGEFSPESLRLGWCQSLSARDEYMLVGSSICTNIKRLEELFCLLE